MFNSILTFIAGLGVFLFATKLLSSSLERLSSVKIKKGLNKLSKNSFSGLGFGTLMATITQSSLASVVMTMSFADSMTISLLSSIAIIFGCNIGTSLSSILVSFNSFSISKFLALFVLIGAVISTFSKNKKAKEVGTILASFGLFFIGLNLLSDATSVFKTSEVFLNFFSSLNSAPLYFIIGVVITFITQSSTVTLAILISLVGGTTGFGVISLTNCAFAIYGSNVGTALNAMMLSISGKVESKKVAFSHVIFNFVGAILFTIFTMFGWLKIFELININSSFTLVLINIVFNVVTALILIPFIKLIHKFCNFAIREKIEKEDAIYYLKANALNNSSIAISELNLCVIDMIERIEKLTLDVEKYCQDYNVTHSKTIGTKLEYLSNLNERVKNNIFLIQSDANGEEENIYFLQVTTKNIERIIKNYFRIINYVKYNKDNKIYFTQKQIYTFKNLFDKLDEITLNVKTIINLINKGENKKEYFIPNLKILESSEELNDMVNKIRREMIATNIYTEKKIEKYDMFTSIVNCIENISANYTDVALTVTNFLTKNKENIL